MFVLLFISWAICWFRVPHRNPNADSVPPQDPHTLADDIPSIIQQFLARLCYRQPIVPQENAVRLQRILQDDFCQFVQYETFSPSRFNKTCAQAVAMAQLSYAGHDPEVQLYIARFTWFMLYLDDMARRMPLDLLAFQLSLITNNEDIEVLSAFRQHLSDAYRLWDAIPANSIVTASLEFVTGCVLEENDEIRSMKIRSTATSWPYFLRTKTGVASAYSFMIFPRLSHPNLRSYIQVIGDINLFIDLTNDVLSFHKENVEGETWNYVSNRSAATGKPVLQTYRDIAEEALASYERICATLEGPELLAWERFVNGYLAFHVTQDRYRLEGILSLPLVRRVTSC